MNNLKTVIKEVIEDEYNLPQPNIVENEVEDRDWAIGCILDHLQTCDLEYHNVSSEHPEAVIFKIDDCNLAVHHSGRVSIIPNSHLSTHSYRSEDY